MTADREPFYWRSNPEWYTVKDNKFILTEKATERARKSFAMASSSRSEKKNPYTS